MVITVEKMRPDEVEVVTAIYIEVLQPDYISFSELAEGKAEGPEKLNDQAANIFREQLIALLNSHKHGFFVATIDHNIVGFVFASLHQTEAGHIECWLDDIGVRQSQQKHGVGNALIDCVIKWGREKGAKYILLESGVKNEPAHHLFESLGFRPLALVFWHAYTDV